MTRDEKARIAAQRHPAVSEGDVEVDSNAPISDGSDEGVYVQAWIWVSNDAIDEIEG